MKNEEEWVEEYEGGHYGVTKCELFDADDTMSGWPLYIVLALCAVILISSGWFIFFFLKVTP